MATIGGKRPFTLWKYEDFKLGAWQDNLTEVGSGDSTRIMELHGNLLPQVADLPVGQDVCVFRERITPMWEDIGNWDGGRWTVKVKNGEVLDEIYIRTLMGFFRLAFEDENWILVNGIYLRRTQSEYKLSLWTSTVPTDERAYSIGLDWKDLMGQSNVKLEYAFHRNHRTLSIKNDPPERNDLLYS